MARPSLLSPEQKAEIRRAALELRPEGNRGYGRTAGAAGRNVTERLVDMAHTRWGVAINARTMQSQLARLGLKPLRTGQGVRWVEEGGQ